MDSSRTSLELLAHFDPPEVGENSRTQLLPSVGAACVLKWAAAGGVLFFASCALLQLAYCVAAERTLSHVARAGVQEVTLPRATRESVAATVERRLAGHSISTGALQIDIELNDAPMPRVFRLADDDRVTVALSLPVAAVLPSWLRTVNFWAGGMQIESQAERQTPGRQLRIAVGNYPAAE